MWIIILMIFSFPFFFLEDNCLHFYMSFLITNFVLTTCNPLTLLGELYGCCITELFKVVPFWIYNACYGGSSFPCDLEGRSMHGWVKACLYLCWRFVWAAGAAKRVYIMHAWAAQQKWFHQIIWVPDIQTDNINCPVTEYSMRYKYRSCIYCLMVNAYLVMYPTAVYWLESCLVVFPRQMLVFEFTGMLSHGVGCIAMDICSFLLLISALIATWPISIFTYLLHWIFFKFILWNSLTNWICAYFKHWWVRILNNICDLN